MPNSTPVTPPLDIQEFWQWLNAHYNCILRAGGPDFVVFDQPDLHWHLSVELDGVLVVQLIRGKDTTAEFYINPADVAFVTSTPEEGDQTLFQLEADPDDDTGPVGHFLMAHPFDDEEALAARPLTH